MPPPFCLDQAVRVSGFTFIRNGIALGYPFIASIRSLLPLCDEIIVNVPRSTDETLRSVRALDSSKIRIIESDWDDTARHSGLVLSHHTNLALRECTGDWCVYIQGDEVLHEDSIRPMHEAMEQQLRHPVVQGLLVDFTHFYGSYWTYVYSFGWYQHEVRIVRRDSNIQSVGDAQGFRTTNNEKLVVKRSGGRYFHYGHALEPTQARDKLRNLSSLYHDDVGVAHEVDGRPARFYDDDQKVRPFTKTHPVVMHDIVTAAHWTYSSHSPLIRFRRDYFWRDIALCIKRGTGISIGVRHNYRLLK